MTEAVLVALIVAIVPTIPAVAALIVSLYARGQITRIHLDINSRVDELLRAAAAKSHAEGFTAGEAAQRDRPAGPAGPPEDL